MSSYWKSLPRYHCTYCNYWCVDNKINRENHENSERHKQNVERFLDRQKTSKERQAAKEREVARIIKKAEEEARETMTGVSHKPISKKNSYAAYFDRPPIQIAYDTIRHYQPQPVVYNGTIPPPPPLPMSIQVPAQSPVSYGASYQASYGTSYGTPYGTSYSTQTTETNNGPVVYDPSKGNIPPPPPLPEETPDTSEKPDTTESPQQEEQPIKYNFDYESTMTEEDLFGSWKTVSVTKLTEADLEKREKQYEQAVMKSNKEKKKSEKKTTQKPSQSASHKPVEEDEDEKDALETYNPFGGSYKGVNISNEEPMYIPK